MKAVHDEAFLKTKLFGYLETAIEKTAFTIPDHEKYKMIFSQWKKEHM
ncbi:hypothetical protein BN130_3047 [Cronobacter malonaticus 507]|nr:hypothetical protein BN130_3047 [Cronobacter malonaticus 507]